MNMATHYFTPTRRKGEVNLIVIAGAKGRHWLLRCVSFNLIVWPYPAIIFPRISFRIFAATVAVIPVTS